MAVYGYIRVSTAYQVDTGHSMEAQRTALEGYCTSKGLVITEMYHEPGISGGKPLHKRPQGKTLTESLKPGDHVVSCKLDRLFRNLIDCLTTVETWQKAGITMHLLDLNVDTSSLTGKLVLQVLAAVSEMERGLTSERNRSVSAHLKATGKVRGHVPYGYRREGSDLLPDPAKQAILQRLRRWQSEGMRPAVMARRLNEEGIPGPKGPIWHRATVSVVLAQG